MKKILFFDCWTRGVKHLISPINEALVKNKFQTKLLHFESIYTPNFPKIKRIGGVDCYDYFYYKTFIVKKILRKERPNLVIFFEAILSEINPI